MIVGLAACAPAKTPASPGVEVERPATYPAPGTCTDAVVFALVGSGQHIRAATDLSVSPQLAAVFDAAAAVVRPAHTVSVRVVDYPADSVSVLFAGVTVFDAEARLRDNIHTYLAGEKQGVTALRRDIAATRDACPDARIALIGYSQGAMVVHEVLNELAGDGAGTGAAVVGAVLLADPERVAHAAPIELGTVGAGTHGVCASVRHLVSCSAPAPLADVRAPYDRRTASVCDRGDAVCDTSELLGELLRHPTVERAKTILHDGMAVHHVYADRPETSAAGSWLGRQIVDALR
jgi:predicted esterase